MTQTASIVDPEQGEQIGVLGPTIRFLTPPDGRTDLPCVMRGTIPPGGMVPLHSHADPETFLALSGAVEGLSYTDDGFALDPGRPRRRLPRAGRRQARVAQSRRRAGGDERREHEPDRHVLPRGRGVAGRRTTRRGDSWRSRRYGYWNATPEENAAIGIVL